MTNNYGEPWKIGCRTQRSVFIDNAGGITIASAAQQLFDEADNGITAERIVACVNACAGIDDLSTIRHPAPAVDELEDLRAIARLARTVTNEADAIPGDMREVVEVPTTPMLDLCDALNKYERTASYCGLPPYAPAPAVDAGEVERLVDALTDAAIRMTNPQASDYTRARNDFTAARAALIEHVTGKGRKEDDGD